MFQANEIHPFPGAPTPLAYEPPGSSDVVQATESEEVGKPTKQFKGRRQTRVRELVEGRFIAPIGVWTRTVCWSDIVKFMECPGKYLRWVEGDKPNKKTVGDAIGSAVHDQVAKDESERTNDVVQLLKSIPVEDRPKAVETVKALIKVAAAAQAKDEAASSVCEKEPEPFIWYNAYTKTWWFAKPDMVAISRDTKGQFLLVDDEKTGKARRRSHGSGAFFMGYTLREAKALGFTGPVKTVVRYLRDEDGEVMEVPEEHTSFISAFRLSDRQEQELYGIERTVQTMDRAWEAGKFELKAGRHCNGCPGELTCQANAPWRAEQERRRAERAQRELVAAPVAVTVQLPANDEVETRCLEVA